MRLEIQIFFLIFSSKDYLQFMQIELVLWITITCVFFFFITRTIIPHEFGGH